MVQNNKVLTVSYGTFSCTLEGFDDSFETMKAIAEYFRDLAADDRYFGSEPPQPDAEMLTRIAQRNDARQVEASQSDTGLLLRATEAPAPAAPTPAAIVPAPTPEPAQPAAPPVPHAPAAHASEPAADSIAAKLQRIRAVVSHSDTGPATDSEEEDTSYLQPAKPKVDAISAAFEFGALSPADLEEPVEDIAPVAMPDPEPEQMEDSPEPVAQDDDIESPAETEAVSDSDVLFSDLDDTTEPEADDEPNILGDAASDDEEEAASDTLTDISEDVISVEDEALLLDEIALVESELNQKTPAEKPEMSGLDQDVSRLMDKADEQLDDPSASNQRETYSHLRTAVAATEAERAEGKGNNPEPEKDYRGDLASVVSPRRPEVEVTSKRPAADVAAPLKLVAEQRIDTDDSDTGPVMPRRVTSDKEDTAEEEGGFATFAQEQGAQSLPDLLEAAAAYLSFIEGQEQFSRPQLMNKVRSLKQDSFNREESLRSFGQLLRDGKIEKAGGGRFAASTQIGFRPNDDERAAG